MTVKKMTPVLFAEEIEPCVQFWVERLAFVKTVEVPEGDKLGFAILQKGNLELMYQSYASARKDVPALEGAEVVIPVRTTFYGAKEIGVKDPAGHIVTFAQFGTSAQK